MGELRAASLGAALLFLAAVALSAAPVPGLAQAAAPVAPPEFTSTAWHDVDRDGRLDEVAVQMSKPVVTASIRPADFSLLRGDVQVHPYTVLADDAPAVGSFRLPFAERLDWRSGTAVLLAYGIDGRAPVSDLSPLGPNPFHGSMVGADGSRVAPLLPAYGDDMAPPVFWGATTQPGPGGNVVGLSFSESVGQCFPAPPYTHCSLEVCEIPAAACQTRTLRPWLEFRNVPQCDTVAFVQPCVALDCITDIDTGPQGTVFPVPSGETIRLVMAFDASKPECHTGGANPVSLGFSESELGKDSFRPNFPGWLQPVASNQPWLDPAEGLALPVDRLKVVDMRSELTGDPLDGVQAATANPGTPRMLLQFNAAVEVPPEAAGGKAFQFVRTSPGGGNVVGADAPDGSDLVEILLGAHLGPGDLQAAGCQAPGSGCAGVRPPEHASRLQVSGDTGIRAHALPAAALVAPGPLRLVDQDRPHATAAVGLDLDEDGWLDTLRLSFSESIPEAAWAGAAVAIRSPGPWLVHDAKDIGAPGMHTDTRMQPPPACLAQLGLPPELSTLAFARAGPSAPEDPSVFLCLDEQAIEPARACPPPASWRLSALCADEGGVVAFAAGTTGPLTRHLPVCLKDLEACRGPHYLPNGFLMADLEGLADAGGLALVPARNLLAQDAAPPRLMAAFTQDRDGSGHLDAYVAVLSEAVRDAGAQPSDFQVEGTTVTALTSQVGDTTGDGGADDATHQGGHDDTLLVRFRSRDRYDTDAVYPLRLAPSCCATADLAGNRLAPPTSGPRGALAAAADLARPVVARADGAVGLASLDLTFSEPVRQPDRACPPDCGLRLSALAYGNGHDGPGASALAALVHDHAGPQPARATVRLDAALSGDDLAQDTIAAALPADAAACPASGCRSAIRQAGGGLDFLRAAVVPIPVGTVQDVTPPGATGPVELGPAARGPGFVARFAAPGDDGSGGGFVAGYIVKVSPTPFGPAGFDAVQSLLATEEFPAVAAPGETESLLLVGPALGGAPTGTPLCVAVRAYDDGRAHPGGSPSRRNLGPPAEAVCGIPSIDSPPGAIRAGLAGLVRSTQARLGWTAPTDEAAGGGGPVSGYLVELAVLARDGQLQAAQAGCDAAFPEGHGLAPVPEAQLAYAPASPAAPGRQQDVTLRGLEPSTTYCARVSARDAAGSLGPPSGMVQWRTLDEDRFPPGPILDAVAGAGATQAVLWWTVPADDEAAAGPLHHESPCGYRWVLRPGTTPMPAPLPPGQDPAPPQPGPGQSASPSAALASLAPAGGAQAVTLAGLQPDTDYAVAVQAEDCAEPPNLGAAGTVVFRTLPLGAPDASGAPPTPCPPADLRAMAGPGPTQVELQWVGPRAPGCGAAVAYDVRANGEPVAGALEPPGPVAPGSLQRLLATGLLPGTEYVFRVATLDASGQASSAADVRVRTLGDPPQPGPATSGASGADGSAGQGAGPDIGAGSTPAGAAGPATGRAWRAWATWAVAAWLGAVLLAGAAAGLRRRRHRQGPAADGPLKP